ncbi:MAG: signal peptidase II [Deltaproteobacteria bacterium]|nr:signal peptidase II [Deltaproteobacteria bacterium]
MNLKQSKYIKLFAIAGIVVILDQITKLAILNNLEFYSSVTVIPGFFNLTHILNPGGAFGFMANQSAGTRGMLFIVISSLAVCLIFYFYCNTPPAYRLLQTAFALIFGGAIGNMIDRFRFGKVVDFLDFYLGELHWPAFNVADSAISTGICIFIIHIIFKKMPE